MTFGIAEEKLECNLLYVHACLAMLMVHTCFHAVLDTEWWMLGQQD